MSNYTKYKDFGNTNEVNDLGEIYEFKSVEDKLSRIKATDKLIVIDIYGSWCAPCKMIYPKYVSLSKKYPNVEFFKENVDLELTPNVTGVPCFHFIKNRKFIPTAVITGADLNEVEKNIEKYM